MKINNNTILHMLLTAALLISSGCMMGPDYSRPKTAAETSDPFYRGGEHIQGANSLNDNYQWWKRFADPVTSFLVDESLRNSPDSKVAAARVLQAQAQYAQAAGATLPQVSYDLQRTRTKTSFNFGTGRISPLTTTYQQNLSVNYVLDFFGKLKRSKRAAWDNLLSAKENQQAVIHSLIANVVTARINIAILERRLGLAKSNRESLQKTLNIVQRRYEQGLLGALDLRLARENFAAAQAAVPQIELSLAQAYHSLDSLLGHKPGYSRDLPQSLADLPDLSAIPVGMPASLLDRRPDVRAAELSLKAANEEIGVSIASLYPDLTLSGSTGRSADLWRDIWIDETETYTAVMRLAQPIFAGGQLQAGVDLAKGRYSELAAQYAKTVLTAVKEVEDALVSERLLKERLKHSRGRLNEAKMAEELSRERYQRGVESILKVFESERRRRTAEEELAILKGDLWTTRVNLFLALGGDWIDEESDKKDEDRKYAEKF